MKNRTGKLSDLIGKVRHDWSKEREEIQALQPGSTRVLNCPPGIPFVKFRNAVIITGRRLHRGDWAMGTVREGMKLTCYLYPKN